MFDIFVKRKKIIIEFFTIDPHSFWCAKPIKATKVLPKWFLDTPKKYLVEGQEQPTIKRCPGLIDLYSRSIAMPAWFDAEFTLEPDGGLQVKGGRGSAEITAHDKRQYEYFVKGSPSRNFKIGSPWAVKSTPDIKILVHEPTWHSYETHDVITLMPGVIDTKYNFATHMNYITRPALETKSIFLEPGDPLAFLTPMTENDFTIHSHHVTESEAAKLGIIGNTWGLSEGTGGAVRSGNRYHKRITDKLKRIYGEEI